MTNAARGFGSLPGAGAPGHEQGFHRAAGEWGRRASAGDIPDMALRAADLVRLLFQNFSKGAAGASGLDTRADTARRRDAATAQGGLEAYILQRVQPEAQMYLAEALEDLATLATGDDEEEDLPPPAPKAVETGRQILEHVIWDCPRRFILSPWEDEGLVLGAGGGHGHRLSVFCNATGSVSVFRVWPGGATDETHCSSDKDPPIEYIREALRSLPPGE